MAEATKRGFHALEKRIHEIEEADRATEARGGERREPKPAEERDAVTPRRPPPAHEE